MKVICINDKGSKQLIKGKEYFLSVLRGKYIYIHGLKSNFSAHRFVDMNGKELDQINKNIRIGIDFDIKEGDSVLCINSELKKFKYGEIYTIENIIQKGFYYARKVKVKGIDTKILPWGNLLKIPKQENRHNIINDVLGNKDNPNIDFYRKYFDKYAKKSMVMKYIHKSMEYLMTTKIENTSVREVFNKLIENNNFIDEKDFDLIKF